jgi:aminomethyltransferase
MKKTPLYDWHIRHGAKMVDFAGWQMPLSYAGVLAEHQAVREACGLFDISHMGEIYFEGPDAKKTVRALTTNDVARLRDHQAQYSLLLDEQGRALDDILVYRLGPERFMLCVNAANLEKDFRWIQSHTQGQVRVEDRSDATAMIALQGPRSFEVLKKLDFDLHQIQRFETRELRLANIPVLLSRTGYTGEEGCEIFAPAASATRLWEALMEAGKEQGLQAVGLGARDTLRLEMGYVLYGHELNSEISPLEAGLSWVVDFTGAAFIGREALIGEKERGLSRQVVGVLLMEAGIPREGMEIFSQDKKIGRVLSGTMSPSLKRGIGTALLDLASLPQSGEIFIDIRGKMKKAKIQKPPFLKRKNSA